MRRCGRPLIGFGRMGTRPPHETHWHYRGDARRIEAAGAGMEAAAPARTERPRGRAPSTGLSASRSVPEWVRRLRSGPAPLPLRMAPLNALVSMGWAGALSCGMQPGDAYVLNEVVDGATGERFATSSPAARRERPGAQVGDHRPCSPCRRKAAAGRNNTKPFWWIWRRRRWPGFARRQGIAFYCLKAVSDVATERFCLTSAGTRTARVSCSWLLCWRMWQYGPAIGRAWLGSSKNGKNGRGAAMAAEPLGR